MFAKALWVSLRTLVFLSGPEDFPHDPGHRLTAASVAWSLAANVLVFGIVGSPLLSLPGAVVNLGLLALATQVTLKARGLGNRFQQTFNTLLVTTGFLTLALVPPFSKAAPVFIEIMKKQAENPDIPVRPDQFPDLQAQAGNALMIMVLLLWQLIVVAYIFVKAGGSKALFFLVGILVLMMMLEAALLSALPA